MERLWPQYAGRLVRRWFAISIFALANVAGALQLYWPWAAESMEDFPVIVWWLVAAFGLAAAGYSVWREDHLAHGVERGQLMARGSIPWRSAKLICQLFDEWVLAEEKRPENVAKNTAERKRKQLLEHAERLRTEALNALPGHATVYAEAAREIIAAGDTRPATMYVYQAICECGVIDRLRSAYRDDEAAEAAPTPPADPQSPKSK